MAKLLKPARHTARVARVCQPRSQERLILAPQLARIPLQLEPFYSSQKQQNSVVKGYAKTDAKTERQRQRREAAKVREDGV